ncbi:MAG: MBL fold metallo-hydrolase [Clostridia bacterium]|nr:MBL fold metallo-hydrolase [Clostridia bacterium]
MNEFHVCTLASSSKGNAVWVKLGEDEILIDAGISAKRLETALAAQGSSLASIKAIFITHEHSDHVTALEVVSKKYQIPIHITEPSAKVYLSSPRTEHAAEAIVIHPPQFSVQVGALEVRSFVTSHDSAASVGYVVTDGTPSHTLALATDIGCITEPVEQALLGVENVILESNHDENMLLCGAYPYQLKRRILSPKGHLSNESAAAFVRRLAESGTRRILLAHLSPENNMPELAEQSAKCALCGHEGCIVCVAAMSEPTRLI